MKRINSAEELSAYFNSCYDAIDIDDEDCLYIGENIYKYPIWVIPMGLVYGARDYYAYKVYTVEDIVALKEALESV
jgi:hypothetical protein